MVRVQVVADQVRARAADVRYDVAYCGLFELIVLVSLRNVQVIVLFGTQVLDVYKFFGDALPPLEPRKIDPAGDLWL